MKVLLYTKGRKWVERSGVGRAIAHQELALALRGVEFTENPGEDYDVVHFNTVLPPSYWMARRARRAGKGVVFHGHSTQEDFQNSFVGSNLLAPLFGRWLRLCYNTADLVLTPTPYSKRLLEGYGLKAPVETVSNGIDTEFFTRRDGQRERFRKAYGLKEDDKAVLCVGLPIERKGILDFAALAEAMPETQFFWFGGAFRGLLPARVRSAMSRALPNLHFPGYADREALRDAYAGSDLFCFLTQEETEGIVLLEALSMRLPVLVRDIPVYEGWLLDGVHLHKGRTFREFEEKARAVLSGELPDLTAKGHEAARARDIRCIGGRLLRFYRQAAGRQQEECSNIVKSPSILTGNVI